MARMHRHDDGLPAEKPSNAGQRVAGDGFVFAADKVGPRAHVTSIDAAAATIRDYAPSRGNPPKLRISLKKYGCNKKLDMRITNCAASEIFYLTDCHVPCSTFYGPRPAFAVHRIPSSRSTR